MSKQNRRAGKSFSTLGQRMLSFGRGIMRTYANETPMQSDTSNEPSRPQGQWRSMTNKNLIWRQEQTSPSGTPRPAIEPNTGFDYSNSDYSNYDEVQEPVQRQPQPRPQQPIQRQPQPQQPAQQPNKQIPSYIKSPDGTPVKVSRKQFPNELQRRLESIAAAHQEVQAERDKKRDKKVESIQRKVDSGEVAPYRRRGSIEVDYVKTESLLPPDERGKSSSPIQTDRQDSSSDNESSAPTTDLSANNEIDDDSEWFDEVPDDDDNIDNLAGFESSEDDIQRLPDDLPRFDASSLSQEEPSDDMGEFEGGFDNFSSQSANPNPTINRDFDNDTEDNFHDVPSLFDTPSESQDSIQRTALDLPELLEFDDGYSDETVPLVPHYSEPSSRPASPSDTPIQRSELEHPNISDNTSNRTENKSVQQDASDDPFMSNESNFNSAPLIDLPPPSESPVQRQAIQRDSFDEPSFNDDLGEDNHIDLPPASESPVQRQTIQRDSFDEPSFNDDLGDENYEYHDNNSGESPVLDTPPVNESPVQRQTMQRDSFDEPIFEDSDYGSDENYSEFDHISNQPSSNDTPNQQPKIQHTQKENTPIQRQNIEHPDLGDGGEYSDLGNETWAEQNNYTPITDALTNDSPVQRDMVQDADFDKPTFDHDSDNKFNNPSTSENQPISNSPIQRTSFDESDFDNDDTFAGEPYTKPSVNSAPVQRETIQRTDFDEPTFEDYESDSVDDPYQLDSTFDGVDSISQQSANDTATVQRRQSESIRPSEMDDRSFEDIGNLESINFQPPSEIDSPSNAQPTQNTPIQRQPSESIRPSEMDDRSFEDIGNLESIDIQPSSQDTPVQRWSDTPLERDEFDDSDNDYNDYGDQTWAEVNNYSPATDGDSTPQSAIQRDIDNTASSLPSLDDNYDHLEDTDGVTAMNILGDYLTERHTPSDTSNDTNAPVQRDYDDETYDYLPPNFDPTPTIYDFNQPANIGTPPTNDTPIQRSPQDMGNNEQPIDLFQALSQAGMIEPKSADATTPQSPIQRDYDNNADYDGMNDYSEYGDATWAEANHYTPPLSDHVTTSGSSSVQRTQNDDMGDVEQPMDLFQAMSQAGMIDNNPNSNSNRTQPPIQRKAQDDNGGGLDNETIDLYNAMIQAGMIQDSGKPSDSSSGSETVQRSAKSSQQSEPSMMDLLSGAAQVSDSTAVNSSNSGDSNPVNIDAIARQVIQRNPTPVTSSENVITPETERQNTDQEIEKDDKEYLSQIARDVFRVIKRRLREEKERRG